LIPFFVKQWIYGSISNGDLQSNSFIGMAYGPPAKKPKTENDEETKRREQDRYSNGMASIVMFILRYLRKDERKLTQLKLS